MPPQASSGNTLDVLPKPSAPGSCKRSGRNDTYTDVSRLPMPDHFASLWSWRRQNCPCRRRYSYLTSRDWIRGGPDETVLGTGTGQPTAKRSGHFQIADRSRLLVA